MDTCVKVDPKDLRDRMTKSIEEFIELGKKAEEQKKELQDKSATKGEE